MKYLESNLVCMNVVSLPVDKQHDITSEISERIDIQNYICSYIYEHEQMKMNAPSYMIKYLSCLLVNFLAKCRAFRACRAHHH